MKDKIKQALGRRLMIIGSRWAGIDIYTVPRHTGGTDIAAMDLSKCQCGHLMHDHLPDPDGRGTMCLSCYAKMRHRPAHADALEASVIGDYEDV